MAHRLVVALCLAVLVMGVVTAQENEEEEYIDPQSSSWRLGSRGERQLAHFQELQDQWSQKERPQADEAQPPVLQRLRRQAGPVSLSLLTAPKAAKKAYQRALDELNKRRPNLERLRADLLKAVDEHPDMAPAWELLGWVSTYEGKAGEARKMFLRSVEADTRYQSGYIALARNAADGGRWQEVIQWSTEAVNLDASTSRAHFYWAVASFQLGDLDVAAREAKDTLEAPDPFLPAYVHQLLGAVHHRQNDFKAAAAEYRIFLEAAPKHPLSAGLAKQVAEWEAEGLVATASRPRKPL